MSFEDLVGHENAKGVPKVRIGEFDFSTIRENSRYILQRKRNLFKKKCSLKNHIYNSTWNNDYFFWSIAIQPLDGHFMRENSRFNFL